MHSQISAEKTPTAHNVYPLIIQLTTKWEEYADDPKFSPVKEALEASLENANKMVLDCEGYNDVLYYAWYVGIFLISVLSQISHSSISYLETHMSSSSLN